MNIMMKITVKMDEDRETKCHWHEMSEMEWDKINKRKRKMNANDDNDKMKQKRNKTKMNMTWNEVTWKENERKMKWNEMKMKWNEMKRKWNENETNMEWKRTLNEMKCGVMTLKKIKRIMTKYSKPKSKWKSKSKGQRLTCAHKTDSVGWG